MARPIKTGIDYFSFDTDFYMDIKIRRIIKGCGARSISVLIYLLCNIYREKGYYMRWDNDMPFDISDTVGVSEGEASETVKKALQVNLFDEEMFEKYGILTSKSIQRRYLQAVAERTIINITKDYWLIGLPIGEKYIFQPENRVIRSNNRVFQPENRVFRPESTQSKVKDRIVKESMGERDARKIAPPNQKINDFELRKKKFMDDCTHFLDTYPKEMMREFFDYWTEPNKSKTKMRFEIEKTWDLARRLKTWENNELKFNGNGRNQKSGDGGLDAELAESIASGLARSRANKANGNR
ncbi:MAG: DUF4373 domain-containing protein [Bacteroidales bacterium]|jgi:hypothetical protein|nr:DUF4373 domain-containing protein [Bacteroidales bacterium]